MGIDHKLNTVADCAISCVRSVLGDRRCFASVLLGGMLLSGTASAYDAERDSPPRDEPRREVTTVRQELRQQDPRTIDLRSYEARAEEQRRAMQEAGRNAEMSRRAGRLTPDERRDLRRQINEVGQDIYATPPRH